MAEAKQRSPNFSMQENSLLAQLMGEEYKGTGLSRHKYDIHRFTSKISRVTKNEMWAEVAEMFSANTTGPQRTADQLEKKWENIVSKHRGIYNDHQRLLSLTGSAPFQSKYDIITESVMAVVGKESAAVQGVGPFTLDTTFIQLTDTSQATIEPTSTAPPQQCDNRAVKRRLDKIGEHAQPTVSAVKPATTCCSHCSLQEMNSLKKKKLELQIRLYKAQLALG